MNPDLFTTFMILLPLPLLIVAERVWTKREDWLLTPREFAEDAFWLGFAALLWIPLYDDVYQTPLSEAFTWLRDRSPLEVTLAPTTVPGLLGAVMLVKLVESFIYYWCHRIQHESLFFWRMHATHHHITKMGCLRGDRTHPLEYLTLALGTPIALALFGASEDVIAVTAAFHFWNGNLNHANLPLRSARYDWIFATAPQHHAHHALELRQSNSNYGCNIIRDRLFGYWRRNRWANWRRNGQAAFHSRAAGLSLLPHQTTDGALSPRRRLVMLAEIACSGRRGFLPWRPLVPPPLRRPQNQELRL